jgi:hypothetical protein
VKRIGTDERRRVAGDRNMALPEHEIAALQLGQRCRRAERTLLHVAVARARDSARQVRNANEYLGNRDEVWLVGVDRLEMARRNKAIGVGHGSRALSCSLRHAADCYN